MTNILVVFILCIGFLNVLADEISGDPHRKFQYQFSFKGPNLVFDENQIPFWTYSESALPSEDQIRLVPSIRSKKGFVWSKKSLAADHFEVEISFKISGRGKLGADGMAIWFTDSPGFEGNVYGNRDMWKGLGVFFDSYDNDGNGNNPYISAMLNDGTVSYDHSRDGGKDILGGCQRDFRNKPYPTKVRIKYYLNKLTVLYSPGLTLEPTWEVCVSTGDIKLPKEFFFGASAATGGLADDHDILSFLTYTLTPPNELKTEKWRLTDEDVKKMSNEFKQFSDDLQKQKDDYRQKHPEKFREADIQTEYEQQDERQLRIIFEGQQRILKEINRLAERVVRTPSQGGSDSIDSQSLRNHQSDVLSKFTSIRDMLNDVQVKTRDIYSAQNKAQGAMESDSLSSDIAFLRNELTRISKDISELRKTPPEVSCISTGSFFALLILQIIAFISYIIYRKKKEDQAKKFF